MGAGAREALDAVHLGAAEESGREQISLFSPEENADRPRAQSESLVIIVFYDGADGVVGALRHAVQGEVVPGL